MKVALVALIAALRAVESSNGADPRARGNDLQITPICVRDVNRIYGTRYTLADRTDPRRSEEIAILYIAHWTAVRRGDTRSVGMSDEELAARIWHRGPSDYTDRIGSAYWSRVSGHLNKTKTQTKGSTSK